MVFDKQGNFVKGLKREDFELRIDGKTKPIEFFEKITAGSVSEESQLAAARGTEIRAGRIPAGNTLPLDRGRPVFFYVDDMHLDLTSMVAARKLITRFIDNEMGQNDEAAIASATGQIGFLQQLTDNKSVLRAALQRLKFRSHTVQDLERPTMTEYQALLITRSDFDTTSYFVEETMRQNPGMTPETAASVVSSRAHQLVQQGGYITVSTLSGLEGLIRSANKLPGRKLVFFISGGFFLDDLNSDSRYRLQRITSAAARSGIVIYSIDARGLVASLTDASTDVNPDPSGRLLRAGMGELSATQDAMNALAYDTGGKPTFNTNALNTGLTGALKETSNYYLLAWKPDGENQHASKFRRLEVKLIGHPNLTVQVRRGFFDREPDSANTKTAKAKAPAKGNGTTETGVLPSPEAELRKVMLAPYPARDIPVSLNLSYVNTPAKGAMLTSVLQVPNEFLSFAPLQGKQTASVTLAGTVFDERGNSGANFNNHITIGADSLEAARGGQDLTYGYPVYVGPGLYQVRVGVRDDQTGRTGTAHGWIEIPNLAAGEFALSSILMGLGAQTSISNASATTNDLQNPVDLSISHRFSPDGFLRFLVFVYNSAPAGTQPDLAVQVQVIREDQPVVTTPLKKISLEGIQDLSRIPYAAEVSLSGLPAGNYILKVTVVDRVAKKSASQQSRFEIE
jgi:VWFA-related protein